METGFRAVKPADVAADATQQGWSIIRADGKFLLQRGMRARRIVPFPGGAIVRRTVSPRQLVVAGLAVAAVIAVAWWL